jgi:hypothetical protein
VIDPKAYDVLIEQIETDMRQARNLGLFRSAEKLHAALNEARSERFEAQPTGVPTEAFLQVGPVREQKL